jgi:carbamoyl-phosphate synthase large subunit
MSKILVAGCGGAPSEGVVKSLLAANDGDEVIGMGSEPTDLMLSKAQRKYVVPYSNAKEYKDKLFRIFKKEKPDMLHAQNDLEVFAISKMRDEIQQSGVKLFMPSHKTIDTCVNKFKSYYKWVKAGVKVPQNIFLNDEKDLKRAFLTLANQDGMIWLRSGDIAGGGRGALPTNDYEFAKRWIDRFKGWGNFMAAEMLTKDTITFLSIWFQGELVVAQTRIRKGWEHGNRTLSGVTGVTKVGQTYSDDKVTEIALNSVMAVDERPHGVFGVDMTYDTTGVPNPTEINISRFFTTILFFTEAGLNMPKIYKDICLYEQFPTLDKKINPLPDGLMWIRGMDTAPRLVTNEIMHDELILNY